MGKQRWQDKDRLASTPTSRPATSGSGGSGKGRWRDKEGPAGGGGVNPRATNIVVALFIFGAVIGLILMLAAWLIPASPTRILVLSANYRTELLPSNGLALRDAENLARQPNWLIDVDRNAISLTRGKMLEKIDELKNSAPSKGFFFWGKTTTIAYVNALGLSLWNDAARQKVPLLIPEGFEAPRGTTSFDDLLNSKVVALENVLDALIENPADHRVLVLDCQRVDHLWPVGVLVNEFVDSVKEMVGRRKEKTPEKFRDLYILFSCSEGEIAWTSPDKGNTPFGFEFARGIAGEADKDNSGRVSLAELFAYLTENASDTARSGRADTQTPMLYVVDGDPQKVDLSIPGGKGVFVEPETPAALESRQATLDRLKVAWQRLFQLRGDNVAPWSYAPQHWRYCEDTLLRAEQFARTGDWDYLESELGNFKSRLEVLENSKRDLKETSPAFSLAMASFFTGQLSPMVGERRPSLLGAKEEGAAPSTPTAIIGVGESNLDKYRDLVQAITLRGEKPDVVAEQIRKQGATPPIEAHLANMLVSFGDATDKERIRSLVETRVLTERLSVPGLFPEEIAPWIRGRIDSADRARRRLEDAFLAGATPLPVSSPATDDGKSPAESLTFADKRAKVVEGAIRTRLDMLAALPHLVNLAAMRPWENRDQPSASFLGQIITQTQVLLDELKKVELTLRLDPWNMKDEEIEGRMKELADATLRTREAWDTIRTRAQSEALRVTNDPGGARLQDDWRRVDELLVLPMEIINDNAVESANRRIELLKKSLLTVKPIESKSETNSGSGVGSVKAPTVEQRLERARVLAKLASSFFSLSAAKDANLTGDNSAQFGAEVAKAWRELNARVNAEITSAPDTSVLALAETAQRILDGFVASSGEGVLRRLRDWRLARFLTWHASRASEDFWAGNKGNANYFEESAKRYLELAAKHDWASAAGRADVAGRLEQLRDLVKKLRLVASATNLDFQGDNDKDLKIAVQAPAGVPTGTAGLRWTHDTKLFDVKWSGPASAELAFKIARTEKAKNTQSQVDFDWRYRGHVRATQVALGFGDPDGGLSAVYDDLRNGKSFYSIRSEGAEKSNLKLMFVLDCSGSMSDDRKMQKLKEALLQFARATSDNSLTVGVRVLGSDVDWRKNDPPDVELRSRKDTKVIMPLANYSRTKFETMVNGLSEKGSTPLFQALVDSVGDFKDVRQGKKVIILISDGKDTWHGIADGVPGPNELRAAFAKQDITINVLTFPGTDVDMAQLRQIKDIGNGELFEANEARDFFKKITGFLGQLSYIATTAGQRIPKEPAPLLPTAQLFEIPSGRFDFQVFDSSERTQAERKGVRVLSGQKHAFVFSKNKLDYEEPSFPAMGRSDNGGPIELVLLDSSRATAGLKIEFAMRHREKPEWRPGRISIFLRPEGQEEAFALHDIAPNGDQYHFPVWKFTLPNWPANVGRGELAIRWLEEGEADDPAPIAVGWGDRVLPQLPAGLDIKRRDFEKDPVTGKLSAKVRITFPKPNIHEWGVTVDDKDALPENIEFSRHTYSEANGLYNGVFVLKGEGKPSTLVLRRPRPIRNNTRINLKFQLGQGRL